MKARKSGNHQTGWTILPIERWPRKHRERGEIAIFRPSVVRRGGPAANLSRKTWEKLCEIYGQLLAWADRKGRLDWDGDPLTFMSIELLVEFVPERRRSVSDATTFGNIRDLAMIMKYLAPEEDWTWIRRCGVGPTRAEARVARAPKPLFPARQLMNSLIIALEEASRAPLTEQTNLRIRDLLMVAVLLSCPIRFRNLWQMRRDVNLIRRKAGWELLFEGDEVKNEQAIHNTLLRVLNPFVDRYLAVDRPGLLQGRETDRMWIASGGRWIAAPTIRGVFNKIGLELLGRGLNPHVFRHVAVTETLDDDPRALENAALLIGHKDISTTVQWYDDSAMTQAQIALQDLWGRVSTGAVGQTRARASQRRPR